MPIQRLLLTATAMGLLSTGAIADVIALEAMDVAEAGIPVVLTPARLRQSLADVPASVTVITADMIAWFGIRSVPDALRLVPGMAVTQVSGTDYRINYHGTNILVPRRMNVLLDGMSIWRSAFARVDWKTLPLAIDDIERIEVTRGPNSASYGPNSMLAIVNIISKHPGEADGGTLKFGYGSQADTQAMLRYGGRFGDATAYRLTLERQQDRGFDTAAPSAENHDSSRLNKLILRAVTEIEQGQTLDWQLGAFQGTSENQAVDPYQATYPLSSLADYYFDAVWRKELTPKHEIQVQAYATYHRNRLNWTSCAPAVFLLPEMYDLWRANPGYASSLLARRPPSGGSRADDVLASQSKAAIARLGAQAGSTVCSHANQDFTEGRADLEVQDTWTLSPTFRTVSGAGLRRDVGDSQTYLAGKVGNNAWRAFLNAEYKPIKFVNINGGGYFEKDQLTGSSFSPRLAINLHVSDTHTLRLLASRAARMPNIQEQKANWTYRVTDITPALNGASQGRFFQSALSPGDLSAEKITSREIGLLANYPQAKILLDAKVFEDRLSNLISEKLQLTNFQPTNHNSTTLRGAELQGSYLPSENWMIHAGYSFLLNTPSTLVEQTQYARNSATIALSHRFRNGWRASLSYYDYGAASDGHGGSGRQTLTVLKDFALHHGSRLTPSFTLTHLNNRTSTYYRDVDLYRENAFNDTLQCFFSVQYTF